MTRRYIYFLDRDRTGLKSAAIGDDIFMWSKLTLPVPVYFKNSDGLTLNSQALCQIRHCPSLPSQLYVESQSRCRVSIKVSHWRELYRALWQIQQKCPLWDKYAEKESGSTRMQNYGSRNHGFTASAEKRCGLWWGRPWLLGHLCPFPSSLSSKQSWEKPEKS